jgi:hypothetical protein
MEVRMAMAEMMEETSAMTVAAVMEGMAAATVTVAMEVMWMYRVYLAEPADTKSSCDNCGSKISEEDP